MMKEQNHDINALHTHFHRPWRRVGHSRRRSCPAISTAAASPQQIGWSILKHGGSALDAVEAAIRSLEDDPAFDAGKGAWLNSAGEVELDAIIMNGATLDNGAVAAVQHVRNPISLARLVMERTSHSLIAGLGAEHFAQAQGIPLCDESELLTGHELERWQMIKTQKNFSVVEAFGGPPHGTVGAVARDVHGHIAAGTSTGGTPNKLQGRVGDSPLIGCGCYADDLSAGASATGWGESIMKVVLCKAGVRLHAAGSRRSSRPPKKRSECWPIGRRGWAA